jgi:hypothetical protein
VEQSEPSGFRIQSESSVTVQPGANGNVQAGSSTAPNATRTCSNNESCPGNGTAYFHIVTSRTALGGQDWRPLMGRGLCGCCYQRFGRQGNFERPNRFGGNQSCTYNKCDDPANSRRYYRITRRTSAGNQERWEDLLGEILCSRCYTYFSKHGTLDRASGGRVIDSEVGPEADTAPMAAAVLP